MRTKRDILIVIYDDIQNSNPAVVMPFAVHGRSNILENINRMSGFLRSCHDAGKKFINAIQHCRRNFRLLRKKHVFLPS